MEVRVGPLMSRDAVLDFPDGPGTFDGSYEYVTIERPTRGKGVVPHLVRIKGAKRWSYKVMKSGSAWCALCTEEGCWKYEVCATRKCSAHSTPPQCRWESEGGERCEEIAAKGRYVCSEHLPEAERERARERERTEEGRAKKREYAREYVTRDVYKQRYKAHQQAEAFKATQRKYRQSEHGRAQKTAYQCKFARTEKGKAARQRYRATDKAKDVKRRYRATDKAKEVERARRKQRYDTEPQYHLACILRGRLRAAINRAKHAKKSAHTFELLGCTIEELSTYIEGRWKPGMDWTNLGSGQGCWVVDHVFPCSSFDLTQASQQRICFHYANLQPLWWSENASKSDKVPTDVTDEVLLGMMATLTVHDDAGDAPEELEESEDCSGEDSDSNGETE
jgi:hypothetical protein